MHWNRKTGYPASRVRSVAPTVLVGSISYLYILSSNFRRCVVCKVSCKICKIWIFGNFLPEAYGYCRCPRPSVRHQVCPRDNSSPVQARITKFGPKMQNTLVKVPIFWGGNQLWPSRSNLRSKSKFTPFWACPHHNSSPIQARITKFGPEVQNTLVKIPIVLGGNWLRPSRSNFT